MNDAPPTGPERERSMPRDAESATLRVLLAEDHPTNRKVMALVLSATDIDLTCVENGAEAVAAVQDASFDLVLMDMQMPVMDGLTAIRAVRALEAAEGRARTTILALTANALPEHDDASKAAGADGHLTKPISAAALLEAVHTWAVPGAALTAA